MADDTTQLSLSEARFRKFTITSAALVLIFIVPIWQLLVFAVRSDLFSYILLIPFISAYLVWLKKKTLPSGTEPAWLWAALLGLCGTAVMLTYWLTAPALWQAEANYLAANIFACLLFFGSVSCLFLGKQVVRAIMFPVGFLVFMVPFPVFLTDGIETFLQHGSATVAGWMFQLSGTPLFKDGLVFHLPGFNLKVAPECSGIHSSVVLFITSLLAGYLFLRNPWKRAALAFAVIPLALLRNGFRVFVIGQLCVRISPDMINSPIHRHGGPLFFLLSLIPFFLLLFYLRKSERTGRPLPDQSSKI